MQPAIPAFPLTPHLEPVTAAWTVPPAHALVRNPRAAKTSHHHTSCSRYQALCVDEDVTTFTRTLVVALPLLLHTCPPPGSDPDDDLVLIVHPDLLLTRTAISETVSCPRRAILSNRLGSTGMTGPVFVCVCVCARLIDVSCPHKKPRMTHPFDMV